MEIGVDIEEIGRIKKAVDRWGNRFLKRIYTQDELNYCFRKRTPYPSLTGRFCVKEAVIKVLGKAIPYKDIEVRNNKFGKPSLFIKGKSSDIAISISHSRKYAVAIAVNNG